MWRHFRLKLQKIAKITTTSKLFFKQKLFNVLLKFLPQRRRRLSLAFSCTKHDHQHQQQHQHQHDHQQQHQHQHQHQQQNITIIKSNQRTFLKSFILDLIFIVLERTHKGNFICIPFCCSNKMSKLDN